jgi:hypothetical protein
MDSGQYQRWWIENHTNHRGGEKIRKIWNKSKLKSEKIWKIQKKIVIRYATYERKVG